VTGNFQIVLCGVLHSGPLGRVRTIQNHNSRIFGKFLNFNSDLTTTDNEIILMDRVTVVVSIGGAVSIIRECRCHSTRDIRLIGLLGGIPIARDFKPNLTIINGGFSRCERELYAMLTSSGE
jgi:hypothetical protein